MGSDLILTFKDEEIAVLGRAHQFYSTSDGHIETDGDKIYDSREEYMSRAGRELAVILGYHEALVDELKKSENEPLAEKLRELTESMEEMLSDIFSDGATWGKKLLLAEMLEEEGMYYELSY